MQSQAQQKRTLALIMTITLALLLIFGIAITYYMNQNNQASGSSAAADSPIQYQIDVKFDEKNMILYGKETVIYQNQSSDQLKDIVFHTFADANRSQETQSNMYKRANEQIQKENPDVKPEEFLGGMDIKNVSISGKSATFDHDSKQQALTVALAQGLQPGQSVTLEIDFQVKIPFGEHRLSHYKDIIYGDHFFPAVSVYEPETHLWNKTPFSTVFETDYYDVADYEVTLDVPENYEVAMPGNLTVKNTEAGRKKVNAVADQTREFVFFASPNYKVNRETRDGLTVQYYYFDNEEGKNKIIDQYVDQAFKVINFFNEKYGKYPYPEFTIAETYVQGLALEFSRLIQMGMTNGKMDPATDTVFVHEIAHQWFHALIGNNSEKESFLDEGFADFSKNYFYEKQGDVLNGFQAIRAEEGAFDISIDSPNDKVGDMADLIYYKKGRQAIYELYRTLGEAKFDQVMQAYFNRYVHKNATIDGLLQVVEDNAGKEVRDAFETSLRKPNYDLKPEYQMSEDEKNDYMLAQFKQVYQSVFKHNEQIPFETMSRIIDKALQGEPLTIVLNDSKNDQAKQQQDLFVEQLNTLFLMMGITPTIIEDQGTAKSNLSKDLAKSNIIVIGNPKSSAFIQAVKADVIKNANEIKFAWQVTMNKPNLSGAYTIKQPMNQNRLLLHFFWTSDALSDASATALMSKGMADLNFSSHFYQYFVMDHKGKLKDEKMVENSIASFFDAAAE